MVLMQRITIGMKIFGQIVAIQPLALIISLPNQLFGHVPITNVSIPFTELLEKSEEQEEDENETTTEGVPSLPDLFHEGQYVRTVVTGVRSAGVTDVSGIGKSRDESVRASKRVELSLSPDKVNYGVKKSDIAQGFVGQPFQCSITSLTSPIDVYSCCKKYRGSWIPVGRRPSRPYYIPPIQRRKSS